MISNKNIIKLNSIACWFDTNKLLIYSCNNDGNPDFDTNMDVLSLQPEWFAQLSVEEKELISQYINKK